MMDRTRREFLRASLLALGLLMVPVTAIVRSRKSEVMDAFGVDELLHSPTFDIRAILEHDLAESLMKHECAMMVKGLDGQPCGRIISIERGPDQGSLMTFTVNREMRDILIEANDVEFSIGYGTRIV